MAKHEKYRVLITFHDLLKSVKNAILTYNSTHFKGVDDDDWQVAAHRLPNNDVIRWLLLLKTISFGNKNDNFH